MLLPNESFCGFRMPGRSSGAIIVAGIFLAIWLLLGVNGINAFGNRCYFVGSFGGQCHFGEGFYFFLWFVAVNLVVGGIYLAQKDSHKATRSDDPPANKYDQQKWQALIAYDPDLGALFEKLKPLGKKWQDEFARSYLALNDKQYLPSIVNKIITLAKEDDQLRADGSLDHLGQKFQSVYKTPHGYMAELKDGKAIHFSQEPPRFYISLNSYKKRTNDDTEWTKLTDLADRRRFYREARRDLEGLFDPR
jgi:hypothetical protein